MKKIYLFCANGLSTSMLVKKMKDAAVKNEFECEIVAHCDLNLHIPVK